ncbi:MAG: LuxR C-terminal-related transcriptional regulator [Syntrophales bacterium]
MRNYIFIIGPRKLQNESMAVLLEHQTGAKCISSTDYFFQINQVENGKNILILLDCPQLEMEKILLHYEQKGPFQALFNVSPGKGIEEKAISMGVRGIFYENDSIDRFVKGIRAIFNGEFWLSREIMAKCILMKKERNNGPKKAISLLTQREREILSIIVGGATNDEIADRLYISPHTVKTHIYNIFKKINVPNRLQAALWVSKNLANN